MRQFVGLLEQWLQTPHSLDWTLETPSGINSSILDKLEHSEEVNQA